MAWFDTNYLHKKQIIIDHTKVSGASDLTSFPVLISRTDTDLKTAGNGGSVQNASGFDIIFTNSTENAKLDHEIEKYVASTGEIEMWVRIPTLSHTVDTVIYIYYDNSTISTSQENITAVWDSNFVAVYHLKETAGTANSIKDSTSNANNGTPYTNFGASTVGDISTSSGQIDGAQSFDGTQRAISAPTSTSLDIAAQNTLTISAWVKRATTSAVGTIVNHGVGGVGGYHLGVGVSPATTNQVKMTKYGVVDIVGGSFPADTNWHYVCEVGTGTDTVAYIDGTLNFSSGNSQNWLSDATTLLVGVDNTSIFWWFGSLDEIRLSKSTRSADWILAEYNNQASPATFYAVGVEQSQGGAVVHLRISDGYGGVFS